MQWCVEEALMEVLELHEAAAAASAAGDADGATAEAAVQKSLERRRRVTGR